MQEKRVLIVDDHAFMRRGLVSLLSSTLNKKGIPHTILEAEELTGAMELARTGNFDLISTDGCYPNNKGEEEKINSTAGLDFLKQVVTEQCSVKAVVMYSGDTDLVLEAKLLDFQEFQFEALDKNIFSSRVWLDRCIKLLSSQNSA